jgi:cation transport ATPase
VRTLLQLEAAEATLLMPAGAGGGVGAAGGSGQYEEQVVASALLQRGDLVLVKGGERLPCDGTLAKALAHGG